MKKQKKAVFVFIIMIILVLACRDKQMPIIEADDIESIEIITQPESKDLNRFYSSQEKIEKITEYINGLSLKERFSENPDDDTGMSYIITITYKSGNRITLNHFGNKFLKQDNKPWKKMNDKQAAYLESIIQSNLTD